VWRSYESSRVGDSGRFADHALLPSWQIALLVRLFLAVLVEAADCGAWPTATHGQRCRRISGQTRPFR
jgi:hypothetical protein